MRKLGYVSGKESHRKSRLLILSLAVLCFSEKYAWLNWTPGESGEGFLH